MPTPPKPPFEIPESEEQIDDPLTREALLWLAHLHSGQERPEDRAAFDQWQDSSPEHRRAAGEARKIWRQIGTSLVPPPKPKTPKLPVVILLAIALSMMAFALGLFGPPRSYLADYRSATGEVRQVVLRDGSTVDLDTGTSFDVSDGGRTITLYTGQVFVNVKQGQGRPFQVIAGNVHARALGTAYAVRRDEDAATVIVTESSVQVTDTMRADGTPVRVDAGWLVRGTPTEGVGIPQRADVTGLTAWRQGGLVFKDRPLEQVVAEVERYRRGRILILEEAVRKLPVTGTVNLAQTGEFLASLEIVLPVSVTQLPGLVVIRRDASRHP
ncbi:FecR domain-containing protein [Bradyrhizobium sp. LHD-71]|uniref:FecR family protein n=1 Tax=Bradyrhizobium sp. LHD-71 TaxID=3072141 RepID=UPI00280EFD21|nr:FecR domain-containing protein [Bradyrhizobium sp. LHD-71]MDQ8732400.1 FecR domain-containing protein [Bradyrhizobium sp. LHD-71]